MATSVLESLTLALLSHWWREFQYRGGGGPRIPGGGGPLMPLGGGPLIPRGGGPLIPGGGGRPVQTTNKQELELCFALNYLLAQRQEHTILYYK